MFSFLFDCVLCLRTFSFTCISVSLTNCVLSLCLAELLVNSLPPKLLVRVPLRLVCLLAPLCFRFCLCFLPLTLFVCFSCRLAV